MVPGFPDVFLLEKGGPFGYIEKEAKNEKDDAQNAELRVPLAGEKAKFVASSCRKKFLTGDMSLIWPILIFRRKESKA